MGAVRSLNRWAHHLAGLALLAMLAVTVVDIVGRSVFNSPLSGTVEVTPLLLVMVVYLGFGHAEHEGDHVAVDLIYLRLGPGAQRVARIIARTISVVVLAVVTWQLWQYAGVQRDGGYTTAVLEWPIHWFVRVATAGAALLLVATVTEIVADALRLDRPGPGGDGDRAGPGPAVPREAAG